MEGIDPTHPLLAVQHPDFDAGEKRESGFGEGLDNLRHITTVEADELEERERLITESGDLVGPDLRLCADGEVLDRRGEAFDQSQSQCVESELRHHDQDGRDRDAFLTKSSAEGIEERHWGDAFVARVDAEMQFRQVHCTGEGVDGPGTEGVVVRAVDLEVDVQGLDDARELTDEGCRLVAIEAVEVQFCHRAEKGE